MMKAEAHEANARSERGGTHPAWRGVVPILSIAGVVAESTLKTTAFGCVSRLMEAQVPLSDEKGLVAGMFSEQSREHGLVDGHGIGHSISNDAVLQAQLNRMTARHKG